MRGRAVQVTDERERYRSLRLLAEKYLPEFSDKFDENMQRSAKRTVVYKITVEQVTGKAKRPK